MGACPSSLFYIPGDGSWGLHDLEHIKRPMQAAAAVRKAGASGRLIFVSCRKNIDSGFRLYRLKLLYAGLLFLRVPGALAEAHGTRG